MAQGGTSSRFGNFLDVGYNICLIFGTAALLFAYRDANVKDVDITVQVNTLKNKMQGHETVAIRSKRSVSLDGVFKKLSDRLDFLEQRFEKASAFAKAEKSSFAALLPFLRGLRGPPGSPGQKGDRGLTGKRGKAGRKGEAGPRGHHIDHKFNTTGMSVYTRWGRTSCPKLTGAKLLYSGISAGQHFTHTGGISNTLCLHPNPEYASYSDSADTSQWIYNVEYEVSAFSPFGQQLHDHDAPCAVCLLETRGTKVMIPGRNICPSGWTMEYKGYLMSETYLNKGRTTAVCVDEEAEPLPGTSANSGGSLWYLVQGTRNPYISGRELTCVVCTR